MRRSTSLTLSTVLLALSVALPGCGPSEAAPSPLPSGVEAQTIKKATVTRVVDGDTIEVTADGQKEKVRMILVDTPETKKPDTEVQPFGPEAEAFTREALENQEVLLERDISAKDRYGRSLYYVWLGDRLFNELLLEKGLARVAVFPPDVKYVEQFRAVQKKAQEAAIGIWSIENYATDKGYDGSKSTPGPTAAHTQSVKPSAAEEIYYKNCSEAYAAGVFNIKRGEPGYRSALDRDKDGVACEK